MNEPEFEPENVDGDDQSIGTAFLWSAGALFVIAVVVVAVILINKRSEPIEVVVDDGPQEGPRRERRAAEVGEALFVDITKTAGVDFVHHNGATGEKWLPETMGGGCAFFDYDADGDPDLLFVDGTSWDGNGEHSTRLYRNDGTGKFDDVTSSSGLDELRGYGLGVAVGDTDGDGWVDLFVTTVGGNRLFRNVDGQRFEDVTDRAGVAGEPGRWSSSAGFFDFDADGDLDLFVCNYIEWSREIDAAVDFKLTGVGRAYGPPTNFGGTQSYLYQNDGSGRFREIGAEAGIHVTHPTTGRPVGKALALGLVDVDDDGDLDVFVANDTVRNFFFRNDGNGKFTEVGEELALAYDEEGKPTGAMGVDFAHYRNDASIGIGVGNFANERTSLYVASAGDLVFSDESVVEGIGASSRQRLTFGLFFFDFDLDGRLDFLQVNGHLEEEINKVQSSQEYRQPAQLFWNTGRETAACFAPVEETGDLGQPVVGRGAAYADIDADGDLDVVLTQIAGPPLLLRNDSVTEAHWLRVRLAQPGANRHAVGARVAIEFDGRRQVRHVMPTRSYLSQVELPVTFGLAESKAPVRVEVRWPDGTEQVVENLAVDRTHVIQR